MTECAWEVFIVPPFALTCYWVWSGEEVDENITYGFDFHYGYEDQGQRIHGNSDRVLAVRDI